MRPLAIVNGILLGSSVAITLGLGVTLFIFWLLLPEHAKAVQPEMQPLAYSTAIFAVVTAVAAAAFIGQLLDKRWKWAAEVLLLAAFCGVGWYYLG